MSIQNEAITFMLKHEDERLYQMFDRSYFSDYLKEHDFIEEHYNRYNCLPTLENFVLKFPDFTIFTEVSKNIQYYIDNLIDNKQQRATAIEYNRIRDGIYAGKKVIDILPQSIEKLRGILNDTVAPSKSSFTDALSSAFSEREDGFNKVYYKTGIPWLDETILGWDKGSDYVVVAGRPGTGKSMVMCKLAVEQLKQGKCVEFYSGEMPLVQILERIVSCFTGINTAAIFKADPSIKIQYLKFINEELPKYNLHIITPQEFGGKYPTAGQLESVCRQDKADVLFIDQQSLMRDAENAKVIWEKSANISRQIKAIRDRMNIPVITAVQLNRSKLDGNGVDTTQIAGSDVIAQDATKIIILKQKADENVIEMNIVKNRNGKSFVSHNFVKHFERCDFTDADLEGFQCLSSGNDELSIF